MTKQKKNWLVIHDENMYFEEDSFTIERVIEHVKDCKTRKGDIWLLDDNVLYCNNCFDLQYKEHIDLVFSDPFYDDLQIIDKLVEFYPTLNGAFDVLTICNDEGMLNYIKKSKLKLQRFFILTFTFNLPCGRQPYLRHYFMIHETVRKNKRQENYEDGFSSVLPIRYRGTLKEKRVHPHQKAVSDMERIIRHFTKEGDTILDLFAGSGSMLIAAKQTKRRCIAVEIIPEFCDIIVKRYYDYTKSSNIFLLRQAEKYKFTEIFDNFKYPYWTTFDYLERQNKIKELSQQL